MSDKSSSVARTGIKIDVFTVKALALGEAKRVLAQTERALSIEKKQFFLPVQNHPTAGYS
jgi:ubiquinone/menaquinone biosynthesis C-methylase UbiE